MESAVLVQKRLMKSPLLILFCFFLVGKQNIKIIDSSEVRPTNRIGIETIYIQQVDMGIVDMFLTVLLETYSLFLSDLTIPTS